MPVLYTAPSLRSAGGLLLIVILRFVRIAGQVRPGRCCSQKALHRARRLRWTALGSRGCQHTFAGGTGRRRLSAPGCSPNRDRSSTAK
jgi:hypothetical protein